jgi:hypothetical protein
MSCGGATDATRPGDLLLAPGHIRSLGENLRAPIHDSKVLLERWQNGGVRMDIDADMLKALGRRRLLQQPLDLRAFTPEARAEIEQMSAKLEETMSQLYCTRESVAVTRGELSDLRARLPALGENAKAAAFHRGAYVSPLFLFLAIYSQMPILTKRDPEVIAREISLDVDRVEADVDRSSAHLEDDFDDIEDESKSDLAKVLEWFDVPSKDFHPSCGDLPAVAAQVVALARKVP